MENAASDPRRSRIEGQIYAGSGFDEYKIADLPHPPIQRSYPQIRFSHLIVVEQAVG